jgi:23S rRNA (uracil1939-C5)-methyltransferase
MLARYEGQIVLVAGAIPGETVRARVDRVARHTAFADTIEVLTPSADRRAAGIDWACGGSLYAHVAYERQLTLKSEVVSDAFERIAKIRLPAPVPVMASREDGYRMRARLHGRGGRLGFFREGTHELCDAAATRQLLPASIAALDTLAAALAPRTIVTCDLAENIAADERAVLATVDALDLTSSYDAPVEGISGLLFADRHDGHPAVAYGSPFVTDRLMVADRPIMLTHHVQSFFQGNRYLLPHLVERVLRHVPEGPVLDLYAGAGLFAVALAAHGRQEIVAVEGDRSSARDLDTNAAAHAGAIRVENRPVEAFLRHSRPPRHGTIVLDPPRTGTSQDALAGIVALRAPRVVYVSCDPATLARDTRRLADAGYTLQHIEAFDLFPNTPHVEIVAVFTV